MKYTLSIPCACALLAIFGCNDDAESPSEPATTSQAPQTVTAAAATLNFAQVSGGGSHTCGLGTDGLAWCWGYNEMSQLGTGSNTGPEECGGAVGPFPCSTRPVA